YAWPGNVREFENTIEQVVLLSPSKTIEIEDLPQHIVATVGEVGNQGLRNESLKEARNRFERQYLEDVLVQAGGNVAAAAKKVEISQRYFYQKMRHYSITGRK
ncbi:MAG: AAA family ATPase, partial [Candidatus Latescibacteria bacterium]|nr:AAA family ATPase [Candidatus Latescibacterota bacterium]